MLGLSPSPRDVDRAACFRRALLECEWREDEAVQRRVRRHEDQLDREWAEEQRRRQRAEQQQRQQSSGRGEHKSDDSSAASASSSAHRRPSLLLDEDALSSAAVAAASSSSLPPQRAVHCPFTPPPLRRPIDQRAMAHSERSQAIKWAEQQRQLERKAEEVPAPSDSASAASAGASSPTNLLAHLTRHAHFARPLERMAEDRSHASIPAGERKDDAPPASAPSAAPQFPPLASDSYAQLSAHPRLSDSPHLPSASRPRPSVQEWKERDEVESEGSTLLMRVPAPASVVRSSSAAAVSSAGSWFSRVSTARESISAADSFSSSSSSSSSLSVDSSTAPDELDDSLSWNASEWSCVQAQLGPGIILERLWRLHNPHWLSKWNAQRLLYRAHSGQAGSSEPSSLSPASALMQAAEPSHPPAGSDACWAALPAHTHTDAQNSNADVIRSAFVPTLHSAFQRSVLFASQDPLSAIDRHRRGPQHLWLCRVLAGHKVGFFNPNEWHDQNERREDFTALLASSVSSSDPRYSEFVMWSGLQCFPLYLCTVQCKC